MKKTITVEPLNKDTFAISRFVFCREVVLFQRGFSIECVYMSTFGLSLVGRLPFRNVLYQSGGSVTRIGKPGLAGLTFKWKNAWVQITLFCYNGNQSSASK